MVIYTRILTMTTKNQSVSVIITTFNRPECLRGAIQSVLAQDFSDFELIVVDDASAGGETENAVKSFYDGRIRYIKNPKNVGSTESLNIGLRESRGDYIAILDDDDEWIDTEKLQKQAAFLSAHPDHAVVGTNFVVVDSSGREIAKSRCPLKDREIRQSIFYSNPVAHSSVMYKREAALAVGGYDKGLARGKDYDLWLKLGMSGKMAVLPDYCVKYREATDGERDIVGARHKDAKATTQVIWRHRNNYPNFLFPYLITLMRQFMFKLLIAAPALYKFYRKMRYNFSALSASA